MKYYINFIRPPLLMNAKKLFTLKLLSWSILYRVLNLENVIVVVIKGIFG
jgi:hypothetical protein